MKYLETDFFIENSTLTINVPQISITLQNDYNYEKTKTCNDWVTKAPIDWKSAILNSKITIIEEVEYILFLRPFFRPYESPYFIFLAHYFKNIHNLRMCKTQKMQMNNRNTQNKLSSFLKP